MKNDYLMYDTCISGKCISFEQHGMSYQKGWCWKESIAFISYTHCKKIIMIKIDIKMSRYDCKAINKKLVRENFGVSGIVQHSSSSMQSTVHWLLLWLLFKCWHNNSMSSKHLCTLLLIEIISLLVIILTKILVNSISMNMILVWHL